MDAGDPAPQYNDVCFPPSLGSSRNDMGAHGGPGACDWGVGVPTYRFCQPAAANVVSATGARIDYSGSTSFAANNFVLNAGPVAPNAPALFFYGPAPIAPVALGNGTRCIGGMHLYRLPVTFATPGGQLTRTTINSALPGGGEFFPGCTWYFQAWYRDVGGPGGMSFNLSDGIAVTFEP